MGLCSGTKQMLVPSIIFSVTADALAREIKGSAISIINGGMDPSGVPPYLEVVVTGMTGCSGSQNDSFQVDKSLEVILPQWNWDYIICNSLGFSDLEARASDLVSKVVGKPSR